MWGICKAYSLCLVASFANFQNGLIFRILTVFSSPRIERLYCVAEMFLACFFAWLLFDLKRPLCKDYSLWFVAVFANLQNGLIFRILALFPSCFCIEQLECLVGTFSACFFAFLIFDPKRRFYKWYSLCFVAVFANYQNGLIFGILSAFSSRFLHRTTGMSRRNALACFFTFLIFDPKRPFCKCYSLCLVTVNANF